jgi:hypothetical protein
LQRVQGDGEFDDGNRKTRIRNLRRREVEYITCEEQLKKEGNDVILIFLGLRAKI